MAAVPASSNGEHEPGFFAPGRWSGWYDHRATPYVILVTAIMLSIGLTIWIGTSSDYWGIGGTFGLGLALAIRGCLTSILCRREERNPNLLSTIDGTPGKIIAGIGYAIAIACVLFLLLNRFAPNEGSAAAMLVLGAALGVSAGLRDAKRKLR